MEDKKKENKQKEIARSLKKSKLIKYLGFLSLRAFDSFYSKSVQTMAYGLAHEIKSPIQGLSGVIELLENFDESEITEGKYKIYLNILNDINKKLSNIMDVMDLCGSNISKSSFFDVDLKIFINNVLDTLVSFDDCKLVNPEIEINLSDDFPDTVGIIPSFLNNVLLNLVRNSYNAIYKSNLEKQKIEINLKYIPCDGDNILNISTDNNDKNDDFFEFLMNKYGKVNLYNINNKYVCRGTILIDVIDTGIGIKQSEFEDIFLPFYSSKLIPGSSGLGLFICKSMVAQMFGEIYVSSSVPGHTVMRVMFKDIFEKEG